MLLNNFQKLLGNYHEYRNDVAFYCPFCHHHKKKFNINLENQKWHCWVCNAKGKKFIHLLKRINAPQDTIKEILKGVDEYQSYNNDKTDKTIYDISLPACFKPLWAESDDIIYRHAIKYLRKREIKFKDIVRYGIGYCDLGIYKNRVIIPSYDKIGKLNYQ